MGDRQQLIAFMSDKPINEVMLKRLLEACLVKPTDGIRMELNSISRNDDQGACAPHNSSLGVDCSRSRFFTLTLRDHSCHPHRLPCGLC